MLHCGVVEEDEDKMVHFYGRLNRNIQDIIDYKEYDSIQRLFQLVVLAEKELQGRQWSTNKSVVVFTPRLPMSIIGAPFHVCRCSFRQYHATFDLFYISEDDHNSYNSEDDFVFPFNLTFL
jgi:hypothetical protein